MTYQNYEPLSICDEGNYKTDGKIHVTVIFIQLRSMYLVTENLEIVLKVIQKVIGSVLL